jgi:hypothetical protein
MIAGDVFVNAWVSAWRLSEHKVKMADSCLVMI